MSQDFNIERVLIPVDFSDTSRKAFYFGLKMAQLLDADTHVLRVEEPLVTMNDPVKVSAEVGRLEEGVRRRLDDLFTKGGMEEVDRRRVKVEIRGGKPWQEIVRYAGEHEVGLIVMATEGHTGMKHILVGSTAERVVRRAPCPVLCVKPDGYDSNIDGIPKKFRT